MKSPIYLLIFCLSLFSCKKDPAPIPVKKDGYVVSGNAKGLVNGLRAYLKSTNEKGYLKNRDTAIIMNETFSFDGNIDSTQAWALEVNSLDGTFYFIIEDSSDISIDINKNDIKQSALKGTILNNEVGRYNHNYRNLSDSLDTTRELYRKRLVAKENVDGMHENIENLKSDLANYPFKFISDHPENPYTLVLLNNMIRRHTGDEGKILSSFDLLPEHLKTSNLGERISRKMPEIKTRYDIISATHIGKIAPNFSGPSPSGKQISLNSVKGKATLVYFWSSWYQASRRENVRLLELYKTYHEKGLEIIAVSLDGSEKQKNPKQDWRNAIRDDKISDWHHISNLNYFNDTISKAYNVKTLPGSFLLNSKGVIVSKNLTGNSLNDKLKELLND